jgi:hypothetical protein
MFMSASLQGTGMPVLDAQEDFRRARRAHARARIRRWLSRSRTRSHPQTLSGTIPLLGVRPRLEVVPLKAIVGTFEPTNHFDSRFRPASETTCSTAATAYRSRARSVSATSKPGFDGAKPGSPWTASRRTAGVIAT